MIYILKKYNGKYIIFLKKYYRIGTSNIIGITK